MRHQPTLARVTGWNHVNGYNPPTAACAAPSNRREPSPRAPGAAASPRRAAERGPLRGSGCPWAARRAMPRPRRRAPRGRPARPSLGRRAPATGGGGGVPAPRRGCRAPAGRPGPVAGPGAGGREHRRTQAEAGCRLPGTAAHQPRHVARHAATGAPHGGRAARGPGACHPAGGRGSCGSPGGRGAPHAARAPGPGPVARRPRPREPGANGPSPICSAVCTAGGDSRGASGHRSGGGRGKGAASLASSAAHRCGRPLG